MKTDNKTPALTKDEALAKVAEVLEEALQEYEMLEKMDISSMEDPSRPEKKDPEAQAEGSDEDKDEEEEDEEDEDKKKKDGEEESEDEEESDDAMKSEYAALSAKMEARGLIKKSEAPKAEVKAEEIKKSEAVTDAKSEELKKSLDTQASEISELKKAIASMAETVNKIAAQPATRKGVSGYAPLKKSEGESDQPLVKSQVVDKLFELKKSGHRGVDTALINRVETNRVTASDINFIKGILA